jgi:hypothetical protein
MTCYSTPLTPSEQAFGKTVRRPRYEATAEADRSRAEVFLLLLAAAFLAWIAYRRRDWPSASRDDVWGLSPPDSEREAGYIGNRLKRPHGCRD